MAEDTDLMKSNRGDTVWQTMKKLFLTFRDQNIAKQTFDTGAAQSKGANQVGDKGTADQFLMKGIGFGGRTLFPYRSGVASSFDRQGRISLYIEEDFDPYANNALDIVSDFVCDEDENGDIITINCEDEKIKRILESLYYDVLNIDTRIWSLTRGLAKFGDYFTLVNWHPQHGVMDLYPLPVHEVEREEGFDEHDPMAVRFKWTTHPHRRINNFEMLHFRLFGNDALLPYGTSMLEASRRSFQQYLMMFDAMMIYRLVRAPERLVFQIEVGNTPPEQVDQFLEEQKMKLKAASAIDTSTGIVDQRYDPMITMEDYFLPKRGDVSSTIEQLPGGTIQGDVEDIEVAINRYISGLKVPKPYLDYSEEWAKANIANLDIRFSKTIRRMQGSLIQELTKAGLIHLMTMGYDGNELFSWNLEMSNPSTIAELQKLEMWEKRINIISSAKQTEVLPTDWIFEEILHFSEQEKSMVKRGLLKDKLYEQLAEKLGEKFTERLIGDGDTTEEGDTEEAGGGEGAEEGGEAEAARNRVAGKSEAKSSYGIPQTTDADLGLESTETQLKRTIPNKGDSLDDPYDKDWLKKMGTNIMEDEDAMDEAKKYLLRNEGRLIHGSKKYASIEKEVEVTPKTLFSRFIEETKQGMDIRAKEMLETQSTVFIDNSSDDDDILSE